MELEYLIPKRVKTKKLIHSLIISKDPIYDKFGEIYKDRIIKEQSRL
jgi:hypothetical protein